MYEIWDLDPTDLFFGHNVKFRSYLVFHLTILLFYAWKLRCQNKPMRHREGFVWSMTDQECNSSLPVAGERLRQEVPRGHIIKLYYCGRLYTKSGWSIKLYRFSNRFLDFLSRFPLSPNIGSKSRYVLYLKWYFSNAILASSLQNSAKPFTHSTILDI